MCHQKKKIFNVPRDKFRMISLDLHDLLITKNAFIIHMKVNSVKTSHKKHLK